MSLAVVILAAGKGTRMRSQQPKVLHKLAGQPLLRHVLTTAQLLNPEKIIIVIGHGAPQIRAAFADEPNIQWVEQTQQLGTGHAVQQALPFIYESQKTLVLYGDVPLTNVETLKALVADCSEKHLALLTAVLDDATGYGRIVRDAQNQVQRIVEQKDASAAELEIREINTGILVAASTLLKQQLPLLKNNNAQGEYYLTDLIAAAVVQNVDIKTTFAKRPQEITGVNSRSQLAALERVHQRELAEALMDAGVTLADPNRIDIRGALSSGEDSFIDVDVVIEGNVTLGRNVRIGPFVHLINCSIADNSEIKSHSVIESAVISEHCTVGPFARLRPGTRLADHAKIGNFVETKQANIGEHSKINHLSYVGDALVGRDVNIGAGTITCNYDGANKHQTIIEDGVFVGSDTQLIAPVKIGRNSTIGAGSTINKDTAENSLTLSRVKQRSIDDWQRPQKKPDTNKSD
ncbi:MAG: bifunctional UDP-N-acetylglucosamine diphosphorylase/glucosamine-1-phosphate N-acetyltransferase GlmU [Gammaproteobacteria bacterium]|nr:bifunctional UDP-N-acetylglucosamine diphosphorylase/glucosamine-1-phosphate N-acetyltransferase GlmU [Gammaproteobacteria bacterium]